MKDNNKVEFEVLYAKYVAWKTSQENQTDGYSEDTDKTCSELFYIFSIGLHFVSLAFTTLSLQIASELLTSQNSH